MRTVLTIAVLLGLLGASVAVAAWVWFEIGEVAISRHGLIALGLGATVTFALGAGLMALVFVSNRRGYDDRAHERLRPPPAESRRPDRADAERPPCEPR
jgi:hypothetical protein